MQDRYLIAIVNSRISLSLELDWTFYYVKFERILPGDLFISRPLRRSDTLNQAIFFDLDGTIWTNRGAGEIMKIRFQEIEFNSRITALAASWIRIAVSNQTFFGKSPKLSLFRVIKYRIKLKKLLRLGLFDAVAICHHHPNSKVGYLNKNCYCRKPNKGLFELAMKHFGLDPKKCIMIGDRITDIVAATGSGINECFLLANKKAFELNESDVTLDSAYFFRLVPDLNQFLQHIERKAENK